MSTFLEILALILLPLAWGLGVEYFFEFLRRRRASRQQDEPPHDWVI